MLERLLKEIGVDLNEADTGSATLFESALVKAWYNLNNLPIPENAIDPSESSKLEKNPNMVSKAEKIIEDLNLQGGESAQQTGRGSSEPITITDFWRQFGATNKTPKTDIILGDKKISVKVGPSQLMSGGKEEAIATFYAAMEDVPNLKDSEEAKAVIDAFDKFVKGTTQSGTVDTNLKSGQDKVINDADNAHKEMKSKLQELFNKNKDFKNAFAKEAMSGYKKFGPDSIASADYVLSSDKSLNKGELHSVNDKGYVEKIADQMNISIRFKSSQTVSAALKTPENPKGKTGKYRFWSVVGLLFDPNKKEIEEYSLNENIFMNTIDKIKNIFNTGIEKIIKFIIPDKEDIDIDFNNDIQF